MTKEEIANLGRLARIALTETETEAFSKEIEGILTYVSAVKDISAEVEDLGPTVGAVNNVLRVDEVIKTNEETRQTILTSFPNRQGDYLVVKKIISQND